MDPIIKKYSISNPRTSEGGWEKKISCDLCEKTVSAYFCIQEKGNMPIAICKSCLVEGIDMIDKELLNQTEKGDE